MLTYPCRTQRTDTSVRHAMRCNTLRRNKYQALRAIVEGLYVIFEPLTIGFRTQSLAYRTDFFVIMCIFVCLLFLSKKWDILTKDLMICLGTKFKIMWVRVLISRKLSMRLVDNEELMWKLKKKCFRNFYHQKCRKHNEF